MGLKEKLINIKNNFFNVSINNNRDYEFETELEDHPLGDQNVYRLRYMNYHRIGGNIGVGPNNVGVIDCAYKPFLLPNGMKREDAFKVLSYLTDYIESELELEVCSLKSVEQLDEVLNLERLGFVRLNIQVPANSSDIIDLFTVDGRILLFKKSDNYSRYFNWYMEGITLGEVKDIYSKCGINFYDLKINNFDEKKRCSKILEKKK